MDMGFLFFVSGGAPKRFGDVDGMIGLLLNGLEVVKRSQDGEVNDRPRRQPWMAAENEFNDSMVIPEPFWCTRLERSLDFKT